MARQITSVHMLSVVALDRGAETPLYQQVYNGIRDGILKGQLAPSDRLPSTRDLSELLAVSRNTIKNAFEQLLAEGFLDARVGSGTYVNAQLPTEFLEARRWHRATSPPSTAPHRLSRRSQLFSGMEGDVVSSPTRDNAFHTGMPALDQFPYELWSQITAQQYRNLPLHLFSIVEDAAGYWPLRQAIASHLNLARGANCRPEQVVITTGAQQALFIVTQLLLDPGEAVWIEEPGYLGARNTLAAAGARIVPVPVDGQGLLVKDGIATEPAAKLVFTTPSRQFPLGATLSLSRRLALLRWASEAGAWIIEDDYDSEYRYAGYPLSCLQGLDTDNRVIYIGSFSKSLLPSLRIGYMVVPHDLVEMFTKALALVNVSVPVVTQAVLAEFMAEGHFYQHIRRMRTLYARRRDLFVTAIDEAVGGQIELGSSDAGMHVVGYLTDRTIDREVSSAARSAGIDVAPLSQFYIDDPRRSGLLLGYTAVAEDRIAYHVKRLSKVLHAISK